MKDIFGDHQQYFEAMVQKAFWEGVKKAQSTGVPRASWSGGALGIKELIAEARAFKHEDDLEDKKNEHIIHQQQNKIKLDEAHQAEMKKAVKFDKAFVEEDHKTDDSAEADGVWYTQVGNPEHM